MPDSSSQPGLREFVRPIVRQKWLLIVVTLAAVAASIGYSLNQDPVYTAKASVAVEDPTRDLGVLGVPLAPSQTPAQVASSAARLVTQSSVLSRTKREARLPLSGKALQDHVSTAVDAASNVVEISATAGRARDAQLLANSFAKSLSSVVNDRLRTQYVSQADELSRRRPKLDKKSLTSIQERQVYDQQIARLRALGAIAQPAKPVDFARRPTAPTSPRPVLNALLGGFLGLVAGLSLVFLRDSFDRRLHSAADIEAEAGLPIFGHVRDHALGRCPGAGDGATLEVNDWEQFRIIRRNLDFMDDGRSPGSVVVTSALPEEGKSTVALYVALASAASGRRTLLIECDLRRPVLASRLGISASPGVTDFVAANAAPSEILQTVAASFDPSEPVTTGDASPSLHQPLVCITAGSPTRQAAEILGSDRFTEMLDHVKGAYDVVVLDTPPMLAVVDALELIPRVSAVLVCARSSRITRDQVRASRAAMARLPERPVGLVVTGTSQVDDKAYGYYGYQ